MYNNEIYCSICNKIINDFDDVIFVGKDIITGKEIYKHIDCKEKIKTKYRREWNRSPVTKIKYSDKLFDRRKDKQKFRKEMEEGDY